MKKVIQGKNDLKSQRPDLAEEWDYELNASFGITPETVLVGSTKEVFWRCKKGHSWKRRIEVRHHQNTGCPYCAGQLAIASENDIATLYPEVLSEWDYELNKKYTPYNTMPGSGHKIHWICPKGHHYTMTPNNKISGKQKCPICSNEMHTSFPEQALLYYLNKICETKSRYRVSRYELDVFIPDCDIAIEYDGIYYHSQKGSVEREQRKNNFCFEKGIILYRIKETNNIIDDKKFILYRKVPEEGNRLNEIIVFFINLVSEKLGKQMKIDVDVNRDKEIIWSQYISIQKENSIASLFPEIAKEWDYSKNGTITPQMVTRGSHNKYYWLCSIGHSYSSDVKHRVSGTGCPYCAGKKVLLGYNDLETWCKNNSQENLLKQWDYDKNGGLLPSKVPPYRNSKVWWRCPLNHSFQAEISKRTMGRGCPECAKESRRRSRFKKVLNVDTGIEYSSIKEASEQIGINQGSIGNVCRGKNQTAGGYHWKFLE